MAKHTNKHKYKIDWHSDINPLNDKLSPVCHLLALLGAHHILHVSGIRVKHIDIIFV